MHLLSFTPLLGLAAFVVAVPVDSSGANFADTKWDVIVVGAGPAGIIVADRMAEAGKKTLLLEDGGPSYGITGGTERPSWLDGTNLSRVDVPGLYKSIFSVPSDLTCNSNTQQTTFGGCTLGGCSAINAGLFFQPPKSDFDTYFPTGWKSADVASAIAKLNSRQPSSAITSENKKRYLQHGYNVAKEWLVTGAGYKETQFKQSPDDKSKVFGHPVFDYDDGQRGGPVISYLQTALKRTNFQLATNTRVQRVARSKSQAYGVVATVNGAQKTILLAPNGRVILSAGALQSPALLMRSAIGDPSTLARLQSAGVFNHAPSTWINNTAVGAGLFDNPNTFIELESSKVNAYTYSYDNPKPSDAQLYLKDRSGPYAFASETSAFWDTVKHADGTFATCQGTIDSSGYGGSATDPHSITLNVYGTSGLLSKGSVLLNDAFIPTPSNDVYFSKIRDIEDVATFIQRIFSHMPKGLRSLNLPQTSSHAQIMQYINSTTQYQYTRGMVNHWSSSCRFGSCVDTNTIVKGMKNLHVVDGSIVPPLSVNPQMGIMIAAEKASENILAL